MNAVSAEVYIFQQIPDTAASEAFSFHQQVASNDQHILPRSEEEIKSFAEKGELFGVRKASSDQLVALCYATLDEEHHEWEVGGLHVLDSLQRLGIGEILVRFVLCLVVAHERPWDSGDKVIAIVHEENQKPRKLLRSIGFQQMPPPEGRVTLPKERAAPSMKRNAEGEIVGHKFNFPREAIKSLCAWLTQNFLGVTLRDGTHAVLQVRPSGPRVIKDALEVEVAKLR